MKQAVKERLKKFPVALNILRKARSFFFHPTKSPIPERIRETLGRKGSVFFVQVGSNDGLQGDPIHALIAKNKKWTGIFIEPVGFVFERLKQNYESSERFIFENVAIGTNKGKTKFFYVSPDAREKLGHDLPVWYDQLGSFDKSHILKHLNGRLEPCIVEEEIQCVPMQEILDKHRVVAIDLLHIDTEGFDYKVLSQIDFNKYKPLIVLYEHKHLPADEREKAQSLLKTHGYKFFDHEGDTLAFL